MRLKQLKMSGFKSFVETTKIPFKSNITGVVGPNGCGKSNVIDAVKWVLGESSAKNLRSDAIADVIFSGSAGRKPAGQASVELLFDNSDGSLTGEYHSYSEISVKRLMNADGNSAYYLNGTKCRRKDITDIFLGTGLGPRSYSIIEQGIISKFVEAKPEDMRVYIEEAAGISKYKERRKETTNKIKATQDNLSRINDLKEELERQLEKIKKQANAAEKYKLLREEERELRLSLLALRWKTTNISIQDLNKKIERSVLDLESAKTDKESIETTLVQNREHAQMYHDEQLEIQEKHFKVNSEVAKIEQSLKHDQDKKEQLTLDLKSIEKDIDTYQADIESEEIQITELQQELDGLQKSGEPEGNSLDATKELYESMENQKSELENSLQVLSDKISQYESAITVEEIKISETLDSKKIMQEQHDNLDQELAQINLSSLSHEQSNMIAKFELIEKSYHEKSQEVNNLNANLLSEEKKYSDLLENEKKYLQEIQEVKVQLAALEASQTASNEANEAKDWVNEHGFSGNDRLRETISVDTGWEIAVDVVLRDKLQAICLEPKDFQGIFNLLDSVNGNIDIVYTCGGESGKNELGLVPLIDKISDSNALVSELLEGVFILDDISQASRFFSLLSQGQSLVTKTGIWLHKNWIRVHKPNDTKDNIISRQARIEELKASAIKMEKSAEEVINDKRSSKNMLDLLKQKIAESSQEKEQAYQQYISADSQLKAIEKHLSEANTRQEKIRKSLQNIESQLLELSRKSEIAEENLKNARESLIPLKQSKEDIYQEKQAFDSRYKAVKQDAEMAMERQHQFTLRENTLTAEIRGLIRNKDRLYSLLEKAIEKQKNLEAVLNSDENEHDLRQQLEGNLNLQLVIEEELRNNQHKIAESNSAIQELEGNRTSIENIIMELSKVSQDLNIELERNKVVANSINEQVTDLDKQTSDLEQYITEDSVEEDISDNLGLILKRIDRLGPINLTAIDEYETERERHEYYEKQSVDLSNALDTLMSAIKKIDQETKTKFKNTFSIINENFKALFPKLFGGGKAELYLTSRDLLDTGVGITAKPPGKKVANITALSGGEKALTAVALVLSIFKLNPSPFCMLDEVDAPLDDANVLRFCEVIKEMAKEVQFIVITHNKVTMEMAEQLSGVTMQEPGVSRLVSVDVEEVINAA